MTRGPNPFGERAPDGPLPGGCGDPLCARRAWAAWQTPGDPLLVAPCGECLEAAADVVLGHVALRPTDEGKRRARRGRSGADLRLSAESADCHIAGPL